MRQAEAFQFVLGYVEEVDVEGNRAYITDSFGRKHNAPIFPRRGGGTIPRVGEQWVLDRSMGELAFHSMLTSNPPLVNDLETLFVALEDLGFVINEDPAPSVPDWEPGMMMQFAGSAAPDFWLLCDGQAVSREDYADLFDVIGTTYGVGDGSTTFNLPDMRQRFPVGAEAGGDYDPGDTGGSTSIGAHTHGTGNLVNASDNHAHNTGNQNSSHSHNTGTDNHSHNTNNASSGASTNHAHGAGNLAARVSLFGNELDIDRIDIANFSADALADLSQTAGPRTGTHGARVVGNTAGPSANANHSHNTSGDNHGHNVSVQNASHSHGVNADNHSHAISGSTASAGSGPSLDNRPPYLAMNFIIYTGLR